MGELLGAIPGPVLVAASAFVLSLAGSLHCVGMCGPFVLLTRGSPAWHAGRITTYVLLGSIAGAVVAVGTAGPARRIGSWIVALVASALLAWSAARLAGLLRPARAAAASGRRGLGARLRDLASEPDRSPTARRVLLGLGTGLLPCGLVYGGLALAATAGSPAGGAAVMAAFGAGTLPLLGLAPVLARRLRGRRLARLRGALAAVALVAGLASIWVRVPSPQGPSAHCHTPADAGVGSATP